MLIFKLFKFKYFLVGLIFGLLLIQIYPNNRKEIIIYPSEKVQETTQYIDSADNCFDFSIKDVECPNNVYSIKNIPIQ